MKKTALITLITVIIIIIFIIVILKAQKPTALISTEGSHPSNFSAQSPWPSPEPSPSPVVLPSGAQTYRFSHGDQVKGPRPESLTLDPFTPEPGQTQTATIKMAEGSRAESAGVELITDNQKTSHQLQLTDTGWQGTWTIEDTFSNIYSLRLTLTGNDGTYDETLYFR